MSMRMPLFHFLFIRNLPTVEKGEKLVINIFQDIDKKKKKDLSILIGNVKVIFIASRSVIIFLFYDIFTCRRALLNTTIPFLLFRNSVKSY